MDTGDLVVRDLVTGTDRRLTSNDSPFATLADASVMSRDGKSVAYSWCDCNRYSLGTIGLGAGSQPRVLFDSPGVAWIAPS